MLPIIGRLIYFLPNSDNQLINISFWSIMPCEINPQVSEGHFVGGYHCHLVGKFYLNFWLVQIRFRWVESFIKSALSNLQDIYTKRCQEDSTTLFHHQGDVTNSWRPTLGGWGAFSFKPLHCYFTFTVFHCTCVYFTLYLLLLLSIKLRSMAIKLFYGWHHTKAAVLPSMTGLISYIELPVSKH